MSAGACWRVLWTVWRRAKGSEFVVGDLLFVDVDAVEDRLAEETALFVVAAPVQLVGVVQ